MRGADPAAGAASFANDGPVAAALWCCVCRCCYVVNRLRAFASGGARAEDRTEGRNPRYEGVLGIFLWRVSRHSPGCGSGDRGDKRPC